jgi:hypothetical protein
MEYHKKCRNEWLIVGVEEKIFIFQIFYDKSYLTWVK